MLRNHIEITWPFWAYVSVSAKKRKYVYYLKLKFSGLLRKGLCKLECVTYIWIVYHHHYHYHDDTMITMSNKPPGFQTSLALPRTLDLRSENLSSHLDLIDKLRNHGISLSFSLFFSIGKMMIILIAPPMYAPQGCYKWQMK